MRGGKIRDGGGRGILTAIELSRGFGPALTPLVPNLMESGELFFCPYPCWARPPVGPVSEAGAPGMMPIQQAAYIGRPIAVHISFEGPEGQ